MVKDSGGYLIAGGNCAQKSGIFACPCLATHGKVVNVLSLYSTT